MARVKDKSNAQGAIAASSYPIQITLDDLDPQAKPAAPLSAQHSSHWSNIRLAILLAVLIPLAIFGYYHHRYTSTMDRIQKSLSMWDDLKAIADIKQLEKSEGLTGQSAFLRSRAYRHMGDDIAFRSERAHV